MASRVTIADVARRAGVHQATVSRALNSRTSGQVNATTATRIQRVAKELGYIPNAVARGLRMSASMTIGVIIPDITNPIFPPMILGIEQYLFPRGYTALIGNTDSNDSTERILFDSLLERRVDGLVFATGHTDHRLLTEAYELGIRAVLVNRSVADVGFPIVTGDDPVGISMAVSHLAQLGHQSIVHISGPANLSTGRARANAFAESARRIGLSEPSIVEADEYSIEAGVRAMDSVLTAGLGIVTAVLAGNDLLALGALRSLRAHGLRCPEDVSVVGFNDMLFAEDFRPPLTTVRLPHLEMGIHAARLLLAEIESPSAAPPTVTLPVSLIVRESTAPPRR
jgi:LacI family transcriptional regulator